MVSTVKGAHHTDKQPYSTKLVEVSSPTRNLLFADAANMSPSLTAVTDSQVIHTPQMENNNTPGSAPSLTSLMSLGRRRDDLQGMAELNTEQAEFVLHHKLEAAAFHYNQVLAWHMERNRLSYETQLRRIRESSASVMVTDTVNTCNRNSEADTKTDGSTFQKKNNSKSSINANSSIPTASGTTSKNWREHLLQSLIAERMRLQRLCDNGRERQARAHKELEVLLALNQSLRGNEDEWKRRVHAAEVKMNLAKDCFR